MSDNTESVPNWVREFEEKIIKVYSELIIISIQRTEHHRQAAEALDKAVNTTQRLTLDFFRGF